MPEFFLVGGAVRDELLGLEVHERDWVVTGATPEWMKQQGYSQVGASFPVFLHPRSKEEYALARTERKAGVGYHGFSVSFGPEVSLEQDLERRDLTINAIARTREGELIDPYNGQRDLQQRLLRHVSPAFVEDPLRVLRVARFAARFAHLGFTVHPETLALMQTLAESGELEHLVPERSWTEIRRAMGGPQPSVFVQVLRDCGALEVLLPEVNALFGVPQPERYHPEVDTGIHLLMALDTAASMGASEDAVVAVLLHDLGKALTPREQWPSHRGHEHSGVPLVEAVCDRFRVSRRMQQLAAQVCRHHLDCHRITQARPVTVMKLLERLDAFRQPDLTDFLDACEADYRGRKGLAERPYPQRARLLEALEAASAVSTAPLLAEGINGPALGEALRTARVQAVAQALVQPGE